MLTVWPQLFLFASFRSTLKTAAGGPPFFVSFLLLVLGCDELGEFDRFLLPVKCRQTDVGRQGVMLLPASENRRDFRFNQKGPVQ